MVYTWDWLFAEGFRPSMAARIMGVKSPVAYREMAMAKLRRYGQRGSDADIVSEETQNNVYDGFIDFHTDGGMSRPVPETDLSRTCLHCPGLC